MGKNAEKKKKLVAEIGFVKKNPDDTTHVILKKESIGSDLEYMANRLGISLDELQAERLKAEKEAREAEQNKRMEKKRIAREAYAAKLDQVFLTNYGEKAHYLITLAGKRITKLKEFGDIRCPVCNEALPAVRGYAHSVVEHPELLECPTNPFSAFNYVPVRIDSAKCPNGHENKVTIQRIL